MYLYTSLNWMIASSPPTTMRAVVQRVTSASVTGEYPKPTYEGLIHFTPRSRWQSDFQYIQRPHGPRRHRNRYVLHLESTPNASLKTSHACKTDDTPTDVDVLSNKMYGVDLLSITLANPNRCVAADSPCAFFQTRAVRCGRRA